MSPTVGIPATPPSQPSTEDNLLFAESVDQGGESVCHLVCFLGRGRTWAYLNVSFHTVASFRWLPVVLHVEQVHVLSQWIFDATHSEIRDRVAHFGLADEDG